MLALVTSKKNKGAAVGPVKDRRERAIERVISFPDHPLDCFGRDKAEG